MVIDDQYITQAEEILDWMSAQGNVPAASRRDELRELRQVARLINTNDDATSFGARPTAPHRQPDQLWNSLDIHAGQNQTEAGLSSFDGMALDFTSDWIADDVTQQDWFWTTQFRGDGDAAAPSFPSIT